MRYANGTVLKLEGPERDHADLGAIFIGERGKIEIKRGSCVADPPELLDGAPPDTPEGPGENRYHIDNFLDCIRSRKQPAAHVEAGHRASTLCHLVNITRDLGRKLRWDPKAERFIGDEQAKHADRQAPAQRLRVAEDLLGATNANHQERVSVIRRCRHVCGCSGLDLFCSTARR